MLVEIAPIELRPRTTSGLELDDSVDRVLDEKRNTLQHYDSIEMSPHVEEFWLHRVASTMDTQAT